MRVWHSINASDSTHIEIRLFCLTFDMMMKVSMVIKGGNVRGRDQGSIHPVILPWATEP